MPQQAQQATEPPSGGVNDSDREIHHHPLENLTLQQTLRVMDVAREMRENRQNAEEMFRQDDQRSALREKLLRTARMSGEDVTEAEIDAAIGQYMDRLHTFQAPPAGFGLWLAHAWIWRGRIASGLAVATTIVASFWFLF